MALDKREIDNRFSYHAPTDAQAALYGDIRNKAKSLATFINRNVPDGRQKSLALTSLEETVMRANAAVAQASPDPETGTTPQVAGRGPGRPRKSAASSTPPAPPETSEMGSPEQVPDEAVTEPVSITRPRRARSKPEGAAVS
jgi:hypothetical protein